MDLYKATIVASEKYLRLIPRGKKLSQQDISFLSQLLMFVESEVINDIRQHQNNIKKLNVSGHDCLAIWGGKLTPGCDTCLKKSGLWAIRATNSCNLDCSFCYCKGIESMELSNKHFKIGNNPRALSEEDIKIIIDKQGKGLSGLAWVSFEPFVDIKKHFNLIRYIGSKGIHQWMYTNGTLITEEDLKILQDCGLNELRFNLAATNVSSKVIKIMKIARKYFEFVCIESPMSKKFVNSFIKKRKEILDIGINQINCAELHLNENNFDEYKNEDIYCYKFGYISPISSRQSTYELIELAEKENWKNITINDCSNETKFYRGVRSDLQFGEIDYAPEMELDFSWYVKAFQKYKNYRIQQS